MKFIKILLLIISISLGYSSLSSVSAEDEFQSVSGPSIHVALGIRNQKAPSLDEFYSAFGGIKLSLLAVHFNEQIYLSLVQLGLNIQRDRLFAPSLTPFALYYSYGVGVGLDFFSVNNRKDRPGGPIGISVNFDVPRLLEYFGMGI